MANTMINIFGATSTTEDVSSGTDLLGKRILVTGVFAGLGVQTARSLAAHGTHVLIALSPWVRPTGLASTILRR
jgi:hypothetical protein